MSDGLCRCSTGEAAHVVPFERLPSLRCLDGLEGQPAGPLGLRSSRDRAVQPRFSHASRTTVRSILGPSLPDWKSVPPSNVPEYRLRAVAWFTLKAIVGPGTRSLDDAPARYLRCSTPKPVEVNWQARSTYGRDTWLSIVSSPRTIWTGSPATGTKLTRPPGAPGPGCTLARARPWSVVCTQSTGILPT